MKDLRIMGVVGSPREDSNTETLVKKALAGAEGSTEKVKTELLLLRDKEIQFCKGCNQICSFNGENCRIKDDMKEILDKLRENDAYIFGTPTYFGTESGILKTFMDRTVPLYGELENKIAGIVTVGDGEFGGQELAAQSIRNFCLMHSMLLINWHVSATAGHGNIAGEISQNSEKFEECRKLGQNIVKFSKKLKRKNDGN